MLVCLACPADSGAGGCEMNAEIHSTVAPLMAGKHPHPHFIKCCAVCIRIHGLIYLWERYCVSFIMLEVFQALINFS